MNLRMQIVQLHANTWLKNVKKVQKIKAMNGRKSAGKDLLWVNNKKFKIFFISPILENIVEVFKDKNYD